MMRKSSVVISAVIVFVCSFIGLFLWMNLSSKPEVKGVRVADPQKSESLQTSSNQQNNSIPLNISGSPSQSLEQQERILSPNEFQEYDKLISSNEIYIQNPQVGNGAEAIKGKKVAVVYKGWLTNGTIFDQSKQNKEDMIEPFVFTVGSGQVIPGWDLGIVGMKVGGVRRLIIPPSSGYGAQRRDPIPPNSVLIFDIQLLEVEK